MMMNCAIVSQNVRLWTLTGAAATGCAAYGCGAHLRCGGVRSAGIWILRRPDRGGRSAARRSAVAGAGPQVVGAAVLPRLLSSSVLPSRPARTVAGF